MWPDGLNKGSPVRIRHRRAAEMRVAAHNPLSHGMRRLSCGKTRVRRPTNDRPDAGRGLHVAIPDQKGASCLSGRDVSEMSTGKSAQYAQKVQAALERSARMALAQHKAFAQGHQADTRELLLDYVRQRAEELGHTPIPAEVVGSPYISSQFPGGWSQAVCMAGLPKLDVHYGKVSADLKSEYKRQAQLRHIKKEQRAEARRKKRKDAEDKVVRRTKDIKPEGNGLLPDYIKTE